MKKRILSIFLSLVLVFTLLPAPVQAAGWPGSGCIRFNYGSEGNYIDITMPTEVGYYTYGTCSGGTAAQTAANQASLPDSGWNWAVLKRNEDSDGVGYILILNDFDLNYSGTDDCFMFECALKIVLMGSNSISATSSGTVLSGNGWSSDLYISGDGSLAITSDGRGIGNTSTTVIRDGIINTNSGDYAIYSNSGCDINGGKFTADNRVWPTPTLGTDVIKESSNPFKSTYNGAIKREVYITAKTGMSVIDGCEEYQEVVDGEAISAITYRAGNGYYFPDDYSVAAQDGISVTRNSISQITVSGIPEDYVIMSLPAASISTFTGVVTITGEEKYGEQLTASVTNDSSNGDNFTYTWMRGSSSVGTGSAYTLKEEDIGKVITCEVSADDCTGVIYKTTGTIKKVDGPDAPTGLDVTVPTSENGTDGKINGTTSLMEYSTDEAFTAPVACGDAVTTGLAAGTYYVRVKETATHKAGASVAVEVPAYVKPTLNGTVTVTGEEKYGEQLTASVTGDNSEGDNFTYTWMRDGSSIGTGTTYTLTADDIGMVITCEVSADDCTGVITGTTGTIEKADGPAAPTGLVGVAPTSENGTDGKISNTTNLMEYSIDEAFSNPVDCTGDTITGLSAGIYYVRVKETTTHKAGESVAVTVPAYTPEPTLTGTVTIAGEEKYGEQLTASVTGDNSAGNSFTYTWKRDGASVGTGATYTLTADDMGKIITCEVSADDITGIISASTGTIEKVDGPAAPTGLVGIAPTSENGTDGKISNTTSAMEYSIDETFTAPVACSNTATTGLTAGTYYVRIKETATHKAGASVSVTVSNHTHTSDSSVWESDEDNHWNICASCTEKLNKAAHEFEWIIDKEATATEDGSKHEECSICVYRKSAVNIPATGSAIQPDILTQPDSPSIPEDTYEDYDPKDSIEYCWSGIEGWQKINNAWYFFDNAGELMTGWVQDKDTRWYYMNSEDGKMVTGWVSSPKSKLWYYMDLANGHMLSNGWICDPESGRWYYLNDTGAMCTGWIFVNDKWYYLDKSGAMCTGWNMINGHWYLMDNSGAMLTGWQSVGDKKYYLVESGECLLNTTTPDGHKVDEAGAKVE